MKKHKKVFLLVLILVIILLVVFFVYQKIKKDTIVPTEPLIEEIDREQIKEELLNYKPEVLEPGKVIIDGFVIEEKSKEEIKEDLLNYKAPELPEEETLSREEVMKQLLGN